MAKLEDRLKAVYGAAGDRERLDSLYDDWAPEYDRDLWATGNPYFALLVAMTARHVADLEAEILDAGCGTGLIGQLLHQVGFSTIDGLDASKGMLSAAEAKGVYRDLYNLLLGAEIDLPNEGYDAVIAGGVLTHGHAPAESLDGLLDLARPGAPIVFSMSEVAVAEDGFGDKMENLTADGRWELLEETPPFQTYPFSEEMAHLRHWICAYRKT